MATPVKPGTSPLDTNFVLLRLGNEMLCTTGFDSPHGDVTINGGTPFKSLTTWPTNTDASNGTTKVYNRALSVQTGGTAGAMPTLGRIGRVSAPCFYTSQNTRPWSLQLDISQTGGATPPWGLSTSPRTCIYVVRTQGVGNNANSASFSYFDSDPWTGGAGDQAGMNIAWYFQDTALHTYLGIDGKRRLASHIEYVSASYNTAGNGHANVDYRNTTKIGCGWEIIVERYSDTGGATYADTDQKVEIGVFRNGVIWWGDSEVYARKKMYVSTLWRVPSGQYIGFQGMLGAIAIWQDALSEANATSACQWLSNYFGLVEPTKLLTIIGDSRVHGWFSTPDTCFVQRVAAVLEPLGVKVAEYGYPGATADQLAASSGADIADAAEPSGLCAGHSITTKVALLHIGLNDIIAGTSAADIYADYCTIADALRAAGYSQVGLIGEYSYPAGSLATENTVRRGLRTLCMADASNKIDFYLDMEDLCPELCADNLNTGSSTDAVAASLANLGGTWAFQRQNSGNTDIKLDGGLDYNSVVDVGVDGIHLGPVGQTMLGTAVANWFAGGGAGETILSLPLLVAALRRPFGRLW